MSKLKLSAKGVFFGFICISLFFILTETKIVLAQEENQKDFFQSKIPSKFQRTIILKIGTSEYNLSPTEISTWLKSEESIRLNSEYLSEIENINICQNANSIACDLSFSFLNRYHLQKYSQFSINKESLKIFLDDLARKINKDPTDARLQIQEGKVSVFVPEEDGVSINIEKSLEIIEEYFKNDEIKEELEIAYIITHPSISAKSINNLGISKIISEGRSNFKGSTRSRIYNINVATKRFQGVLISPGEEFSFIEILGEVDGEHGYLPELVIKKDKTEPEFGGGICQVSTTTFRAAINAGLKITARRNHAYPVQYYNPQGMDATVYVPRPDLRFINNTPGHILIQTEINGTELVFKFYGTDDGRKIEIEGPKIIERNSDGSMKTTFSQKVTDKEGKIIIEDVFNSNYDSPNKYPHPGDILTEKPEDWSKSEWKKYKEEHNI